MSTKQFPFNFNDEPIVRDLLCRHWPLKEETTASINSFTITMSREKIQDLLPYLDFPEDRGGVESDKDEDLDEDEEEEKMSDSEEKMIPDIPSSAIVAEGERVHAICTTKDGIDLGYKQTLHNSDRIKEINGITITSKKQFLQELDSNFFRTQSITVIPALLSPAIHVRNGVNEPNLLSYGVKPEWIAEAKANIAYADGNWDKATELYVQSNN
eukprot:UN30596